MTVTQKLLEIPAGYLRQHCCLRHRQNMQLVKCQCQLFPKRRFNLIRWNAQSCDYVSRYCQGHLRHTQQYSTGPRFLEARKMQMAYTTATNIIASMGPRSRERGDSG